MTRIAPCRSRRLSRRLVTVLLMFLASCVLCALPLIAAQESHAPAASPYIDVHTHIEIGMADKAFAQAAETMKGDNRAKYLFMPSPFDDAGHGAFDIELLQAAAKKYGSR